MIKVLFSARDGQFDEYAPHLRACFATHGLDADLATDHAPELVDYIIYAPSGPLRDFAPYTRCKAVLSLWAGVEKIVGNQSLTQPLCRMVDSGLTQGMVEWVTGHVLRHHLGMDRMIINPDRIWDDTPPPLAKTRRVGILGLGALGTGCANALRALGFAVSGWSRRAKQVNGVTCYHGPDGLHNMLRGSDMVVLLLPDTQATENTLNAQTLALLPRGAVIINPGRGPLIDDDALLQALNTGQIGHATLDVFRQEPLPHDHPYWAHPNVTVTPHIASATRADTSSQVIADNIHRSENGQPLLHLVDRAAGY